MTILRMKKKAYFAVATLALIANGAMAQQFNSGIPATWTCFGTCGTSADVVGPSVVSSLPSAYGWVSTFGGPDAISPFPNASVPANGFGGVGNTNGSILRSTAFSAIAGEKLNFQFNYVTSDGATFADYAWARLLTAGSLSETDVIFTARTNAAGGPTVPGFGLPNPNVTLTPSSALVIDAGYKPTDGGPLWSPLGASFNGTCYDVGCGYTGWVGASYSMLNSGNYVLEFGVTNWNDTAWDSGMAFNSVTIGTGRLGEDVEIDDDSRHVTAIPEPDSYAMLLAGLGLLVFEVRRQARKNAAAA